MWQVFLINKWKAEESLTNIHLLSTSSNFGGFASALRPGFGEIGGGFLGPSAETTAVFLRAGFLWVFMSSVTFRKPFVTSPPRFKDANRAARASSCAWKNKREICWNVFRCALFAEKGFPQSLSPFGITSSRDTNLHLAQNLLQRYTESQPACILTFLALIKITLGRSN